MQPAENTGTVTPMHGELTRKLIHYASAAIPIGYFFIQKDIVLVILAVLLIFMAVFELLKYKSNLMHKIYVKYFKHMLREHEYDRLKFRLNGATWVIFASVFCIILFPKLIAITGLLMLCFADSTSALLGRIYGKKQYAPNRSYVGTVSFFIVGIVIILLAPKYFGGVKEYIIAVIAVAVTTVADALSLPVDDNFTIPVVCCGVMYLLYILLYPGVNLM